MWKWELAKYMFTYRFGTELAQFISWFVKSKTASNYKTDDHWNVKWNRKEGR